MKLGIRPFVPAALAAAVLAACGGSDNNANVNTKPAYLGAIKVTTYDGSTDDLLTAGLGKTGLAAAAAPAYADPLKPTAAELRRTVIHTSYRGMLDMTADGGYGTLYGPNVDAKGVVTAGEGKVPGTEYIAFADEVDGRIFITALRNIQAGEELNYDYGLIIEERYTKKLKAEYPCWCGAATCRGTLLAPKRGWRPPMPDLPAPEPRVGPAKPAKPSKAAKGRKA